MRSVRRPVSRRSVIFARSVLIAFLLAVGIHRISAATGPLRSNVQISQVYGGGGNTGAPYTHDFVELHNPGANTVSVNGWALQYASATGTTWTVLNLPNATIAPGGYFLIQLATGGATGSPLPSTEASGPINMSSTTGKVALTNSTVALSGACPAGGQIQDFVGYGASADCYEGAGVTPAPSNSTSVKRTVDACGDTNANSTDFGAVAPAPRNSASSANLCEATVNETNDATEVNYCNLQFPTTFSVATGATTPDIFAQVFHAGVTEAGGASAVITAQIGFGASGVDPATQSGFTWFPATFNTQIGNNDEYMASFAAPAPGAYLFASRFTLDGVNWTYCDADGAGSNSSLVFSTAQLGTMTVTVPAGAPGAPTGVAGIGGNQQVSLSWSPPLDPGSSAITGYQAQVATSADGVYTNATGCTVNTNATNCTATGLTNGTTYFFKVAARNDSGSGGYSAASNGVTPGILPGAPTGVTGVAANQQVSLSWTAPASLGTPALTGYQVQIATAVDGSYTNAAGCATNSTTTSCTATGLTNNTTYFFKVAGINATGTGPYSSASSGLMPGIAPGAPTAIINMRGNQQVSLSWSAPSDPGSSAVNGYQAQVATSAGGTYTDAAGCTVNSATTSCVATGLTNGTTYFFRVAARNAFGFGPYSSASGGSIPATVPGPPTAVSANPGSTAATISFSPPASDGGDPITLYTAVASPGGSSASGTASPLLITGLTNGTSYTFVVTAQNAIGVGETSASSSPITPLPTQFTDHPVAAGGPIRMVHILELRNSINQTRQAFGLLAIAFTDTLVAGSTPVRALHLTELRTALAEVYTQRGMTPPTYSDPTVTTATAIRAVHINELRSAVIAVQ